MKLQIPHVNSNIYNLRFQVLTAASTLKYYFNKTTQRYIPES
jgi:hypothetical protein